MISDSWAVQLTGSHSAEVFASSGSYTFPGITTVAASGDNGYLGSRTNDYPAALGDVTAAGGTTLVPASSSGAQSARGFDEYAWSGAGSGCAWHVTKPAWQTDTGCTGRSYNDLSADADPVTGMQVYDFDEGGWEVVGGTSEATPLIAAYYALVGSATQGPSWAYANAALLNDPTTGSNGLRARSPTSATPAPATTARRAWAASPARSSPALPASAVPDRTAPTPRASAHLGRAPGRRLSERDRHHVLVGVRHDHVLRSADSGNRHRRRARRPYR